MKRYTLLYYIAALFSLTTISCSDENSLGDMYEPSGHYLYVSPTSLTFTSSAASKDCSSYNQYQLYSIFICYVVYSNSVNRW